ncbi:pilus assembly protein [Herminiimonas sp. KBW02]|uniref:fimbrial biogenesis chaperone n=1 Tax=Herminiimonas sp. KBW02 TaxID=2153363 RepID=UPI000F5AE202|nr:molecular chaperone [Herminiimonas sp. KBW02]RQO33339.1 pilus assembly protein [Herminiimonas sp. KBW02]
MLTKSRFYGCMLILLSTLFHVQARASVAMETRVIFSAKEKEATVRLSNVGAQPALVQVWLDRGNTQEDISAIDLPFVLTPAIFRMEANGTQVLRIIHTGEQLPLNKESLYWLNVLDVPPKPVAGAGQGSLQLAIRTRIKMMYRPEGLPGKAEEAPGKLIWTVGLNEHKQTVLQARNPSAYVVNLAGIEIRAGNKKLQAGPGHVLPGDMAAFVIDGAVDVKLKGARLAYSSVNDWGGNAFHEATIAE